MPSAEQLTELEPAPWGIPAIDTYVLYLVIVEYRNMCLPDKALTDFGKVMCDLRFAMSLLKKATYGEVWLQDTQS